MTTQQYQSTIVIPTVQRKDGYDYLSRNLQVITCFFDLNKTKVLILDGSDPESGKINEKNCHSAGVGYRYYGTDVHFYERLSDGFNSVDTPLVSTYADDDFLDPTGYYNAVDFLMQHPDYAVAFGSYLGFEFDASGAIQCWPGYANATTVETEDTLDRLFEFMKINFSVHYAVHRTENIQKAYADILDYTDFEDYKFFELIAQCIPALYGKLKKVDGFYMAREEGQSTPYERVTMGEELLRPAFSSRYQRYQECMCKHIKQLHPELDNSLIIEAINLIYSNHLTHYIKPFRLNNRWKMFNQKRVGISTDKSDSVGVVSRPKWVDLIRHPKKIFKRKKVFNQNRPEYQRLLNFMTQYEAEHPRKL